MCTDRARGWREGYEKLISGKNYLSKEKQTGINME